MPAPTDREQLARRYILCTPGGRQWMAATNDEAQAKRWADACPDPMEVRARQPWIAGSATLALAKLPVIHRNPLCPPTTP